jgi:hypothetical protein
MENTLISVNDEGDGNIVVYLPGCKCQGYELEEYVFAVSCIVDFLAERYAVPLRSVLEMVTYEVEGLIK